LRLTTKDGAVRLEIQAKPRAGKSRIVGVRDGALVVALAAPPVDGAANQELVNVLARALGIAKSAVEIVRGETSKTKLVAVRGLAEDELRQRLAPRAEQE
jgi:uncharacterized protein (TIGR00251 family)